jgi:predicted nucleic acid-binding protein
MLVVDASAVFDLLLELPPAAAVARHMHNHDDYLAAPHTVDLEVMHALSRSVLSGRITPARADEAVADLLGLRLERYPHELFLPRIWHLRHNFSPYDAAYLALAEILADEGVPLLTTDAGFARAARKHGGVEVLLAA